MGYKMVISLKKKPLVIIFIILLLIMPQPSWSESGMYDGERRNGLPHGHGTFTWKDGSFYVGEWRNGKRHGQGKYRDVKTGTIISADFVNDFVHGRCFYAYSNGDRFFGTCKNAKKYNGTYTYSSGKVIKYSKGVVVRY